jgi:hypothetical protein
MSDECVVEPSLGAEGSDDVAPAAVVVVAPTVAVVPALVVVLSLGSESVGIPPELEAVDVASGDVS